MRHFTTCVIATIFVFMLSPSKPCFADADKKKINIICSDIEVTTFDVAVKKSLLPMNFSTTDKEIKRVILMNRLFAKAAEKKYIDDKRFQKEIELEFEKIMANRYRKVILEDVDISEDILKSYYFANPRKYIKSKQYRISAVVLDNKIVADKISKEIKDGAITFADAVKENSIDETSRMYGGDFGWIYSNKLPPEFYKAIKDKSIDFISKPCFFQQRWYIVQVTDINPAKKISFAQAKNDIKKSITRKEFLKAEKKAVDDLKKQVGVICDGE